VGSGKSADPILHREPSLSKHRSDAMGDIKNQRRVEYLSLYLIYDLKG
jgi:hypothetical protein